MQSPEYRPGQKEDFDRLYRATYNRIFRTLVTIAGDAAAAEDCTQDAFLQAFKAWRNWKQDAPAEAWLHRIASTRPSPTVASRSSARSEN
jgi:RNA polymerase sigma-70 factor (ECF subfamily)